MSCKKFLGVAVAILSLNALRNGGCMFRVRVTPKNYEAE